MIDFGSMLLFECSLGEIFPVQDDIETYLEVLNVEGGVKILLWSNGKDESYPPLGEVVLKSEEVLKLANRLIYMAKVLEMKEVYEKAKKERELINNKTGK